MPPTTDHEGRVRELPNVLDPTLLWSMLESVLGRAIDKSEWPQVRKELFNELDTVLKDHDIVLSPAERAKLLKLVDSEAGKLMDDIQGINEIVHHYGELLKMLRSFYEFYNDPLNYFDAKQGFFWDKATKGNNVHTLQAFRQALEGLRIGDFDHLIKKIEDHVSINPSLADFFEKLALIEHRKDALLGDAAPTEPNFLTLVNMEQMIHDSRSDPTVKTDLETNFTYADHFNSQIQIIKLSIQGILDREDEIKEKMDQLVIVKTQERKRLIADITRIRAAKSIKHRKDRDPETGALRVLVLCHEYEKGAGVTAVTRKLEAEFDKDQDIIADVIQSPPPGVTGKKYNFYYKGNLKQREQFDKTGQLIQFLQEFGYDIIHVHSLTFAPFYQGCIQQLKDMNPNAKIIYTCHSVVKYEAFTQEQDVSHRQDEITAQTELMRVADRITHLTNYGRVIAHGSWEQIKELTGNKIQATHPEFSNKAVIIPNGIELDYKFFKFGWTNPRVAKPEKFTFIGRLAPEKGCKKLAEEWVKIHKAIPEAQIEFIGDEAVGSGELARMLDALNTIPNPSDPKKYVWKISRWKEGAALETAYKNDIDVVILPSISESFSIVTLEAFAKNKPVIISNVDGPRELFIVEPDVRARHLHKYAVGIDPKQPDTFLEAIQFCRDEPDQLRRMVHDAREVIVQKWNWQVVGVTYERLYKSTLGETPFESEFKPMDELPDVDYPGETAPGTVNVGLVYDLDKLWDHFVPYIKKAGFNVKLWGKGYKPHEQDLEEFVKNNDLILVCWLSGITLWERLIEICNRLGKPVIMKYENGLGMDQANIKSEGLRNALRGATILAPTDLLGSEILTNIGISPERQVILPNGVNVSEIKRIDTNIVENKRHFGLPETRVIGGFLGRLDIPKNFLYAIKAYEKLCGEQNASDKMLLIKGYVPEDLNFELEVNYMPGRTGKLSDNLIDLSKEVVDRYGGVIKGDDMADYINVGPMGQETFLLDQGKGMLAQHDFWRFMAACDFILMPSGWGVGNVRVVAEAMALGKPVVMLDAISHPFAYGSAGIYIPTSPTRSKYIDGDPMYMPDLDGFKDVLSRVFNDKAYLAQKSKESIEYAERYMDNEKIATQRLIPLMEDLVKTFDPKTNTYDTTRTTALFQKISSGMAPTHEIPSPLPGTPWKPVLKKPLHVVIVCFDLKGDRKDEYLMTVYAALSIFKKHAQYDPSQINVHIYTDNDAPFHYIKDKVNIRVMTRPEMDAWMNQGADPYVFFIKMEVLKEMAASTTDPFFFMDSDIIMLKDLKPVVESLSKDVSFMAKAEYKLNERTNTQGFMQNLRQMCDDGDTTALHIKSELGGLSDHFLSGEMMMWNAGIVGLDPSNFDIIDKSIALTKEFLEVRKTMAPEFHIHTIEQISYALFLSMQSKLYPAEHYLNHYWGDKPTYIHKIKVFLDKVYDEGISFDDLIYTNKHDDIWFYSV